MRTIVCAVIAFLLMLPGVVHAQLAPVAPPGAPRPGMPPRDAQAEQKTGTARLAGRVFNAEGGRPLRRAVVRAMSPELREGRSVSTDADGRWEIKDLPAGRYSILISKGGFVPLQYGQRRPFEQGKPIELADGQRVEKLDVSLPKGSVITGRIVDEFGEAVSGARVAAMRYRFVQGGRRLTPAGSMGTFDMTDDLGQYRLHGLPPGEYYVSASLSTGFMMEVSADRTGYTETYYPGTATATEAQRVSVGMGQEISEITFALTAARVANVSGTVTTSAGRPVANEMVALTPAAQTTMFFSPPRMGRTRPDGSFTISNVAAGEYRLEVRSTVDSEGVASTGPVVAESASVPITVSDRDITGVPIVTAPTATASGRIVFDTGAPPGFAPGALMVFGMPDTPVMGMFPGGQARVRDDWTFEAKGLSGRRFIRIMSLPPGWSFKSVTLNERDVTDSPVDFKPGEHVSGFEVTLTQRMASISGTVQGERGAPAGDYVAIAFSSDSRRWGYQTRYVRSARPDQSGTFVIRSLPPDDYLVAAVEFLEPGEEADTELLESLRHHATAVRVADGESKTVTLKLAPGR